MKITHAPDPVRIYRKDKFGVLSGTHIAVGKGFSAATFTWPLFPDVHEAWEWLEKHGEEDAEYYILPAWARK